MTLLVEVVGIIVLAAAARALVPDRSISLTTAVAAIAVALGGVSLWLGGYPRLRTLLNEHASDEGTTVEQADWAAGGSFPADEGFLAWVDAHIPKDATVYLACNGHCPGEWVTFRLTPRAFVTSPSEAQYALFYDIPPSSAAYARGKPLEVFAPANTSGDAEFVAGQEAIVKLRR